MSASIPYSRAPLINFQSRNIDVSLLPTSSLEKILHLITTLLN